MAMPDRRPNLRVLIVDDHALIAQGVRVALEAEGVEVEVCTGPTVADVLGAVGRFRPDVVLLDLQLGGALGSGLDLIDPLGRSGAKILVLTGVTDRPTLAACLEAGASGLAAKSDPFDTLVAKVIAAADGEELISDPERYAYLDELRDWRTAERQRLAPFASLTPRESDVLADLMRGKQADTIAEEHYVSVATIRSQIRSILQKLGVSSQLAAVAMAREADWSAEAAASV